MGNTRVNDEKEEKEEIYASDEDNEEAYSSDNEERGKVASEKIQTFASEEMISAAQFEEIKNEQIKRIQNGILNQQMFFKRHGKEHIKIYQDYLDKLKKHTHTIK